MVPHKPGLERPQTGAFPEMGCLSFFFSLVKTRADLVGRVREGSRE